MTMTADARRVLYLGASGAEPGILLVAGDEGERVTRVASFAQSLGVYALALSPSLEYVAAGLRDKTVYVVHEKQVADLNGQVMVWRRNRDGTLPGGAQHTWFQPTSIVALDFVGADRLAAGGVGGELGVYVIGSERPAHLLQAHHGPVLGIRAVGDGRVATAGADGALRVWDVESGRCVHAVSLDTALMPVKAGLAIHAAPERGVVISQSPAGALRSLDLASGAVTTIDTPAPVSAWTLAGEWIVAALRTGGAIVFRHLDGGAWEETVGRSDAVFTLGALGSGEVVAVYVDQRVDGRVDGWAERVRLDAEGVPVRLPVRDVRSAVGIPRSAYVEQERNERDALIGTHLRGAERSLDEGDFDGAARHIDALERYGCLDEALVLRAELFGRQGFPLRELFMRRLLAERLPSEPQAAPLWYAYAELLERVREPWRAAEVWRKLTTFAPDYEDVADRAERFPAGPPVAESDDIVRDDLWESPALLLQEVEKFAALDVPWRWTATVRRDARETRAEVEWGRVQPLLGRDVTALEQLCRVVGADGELREERWLVVRAESASLSGVSVAAAIARHNDRLQLVLRELIEPAARTSATDAAEELASRLQALEQPAIQRWVTDTKAAIARAVLEAQRSARQRLF